MRSVAVIGAGPAGSIAALLLARRGWGVELVEHHRFPRRKVCGECVSALGVDVLERAGLSDQIGRAGAVRLRRSAFVATDGGEAVARLPREMVGISRWVMDAVLLEAARGAGVNVHQPARVQNVDAAQRRVELRDLVDNSVSQLSYRYLIVSAGNRVVGMDGPGVTGDLGTAAHFEGVRDEGDAITLFALRGHYCGLAPIEGGGWNVAMSVPAARVRDVDGDLGAVWKGALAENEGLARRMRNARQRSEWLAAPLPRFGVRAHWPEGVIPVGNAAAALEPIGGEGMGLAMRSAELAAEAMDACERAGRALDVRALHRAYRELWRWRRVVCRAGAMVAVRPGVAKMVVSLLSREPRVGAAMLALAGKSA
jgi:2-polyprenyl-6-methoxyphenol hydroxylase-like FAD-dependent oxidoreductase